MISVVLPGLELGDSFSTEIKLLLVLLWVLALKKLGWYF
jgi:hypothetical protein